MAKAKEAIQAKSGQGLAITAQGKAPLSKKQIQFNNLTKKIEKLRRDIADVDECSRVFMKALDEFVVPAAEAVAKAKIALAMTLEEGSLAQKFSRPQKEDIGVCIVDLCSQAFETIVPSDEEKALYDRWAEESYDEEMDWQEAAQKDMVQSMFSEMFGVDIDIDELQNNPEKMAEVQEEIQRKMEEREEQEEEEELEEMTKQEKRRHKARAKAEAAREAKQKAVDELKSKSLRSIYISLAKLIHPDTEKDPERRAAKEEEMKKLSAAYENDDLTTLLAMEMDWIHKQTDHLGSIAEDQLSLYVEVLKDQVNELEKEKLSYQMDPRFASIRDYIRLKKDPGLRRIKTDARSLNQKVLDLNRQARSLQGPGAGKKIKNFVAEYVKSMEMWGWF